MRPFKLIRDCGFLGIAVLMASKGVGSPREDQVLLLGGAGIFAAIWAVVVFGML